MQELSRGRFLRRVGGGAVVAVVGVALPASALADDDQDRANVRLVAASKRLTPHLVHDLARSRVGA